jgi:hypothetical protein
MPASCALAPAVPDTTNFDAAGPHLAPETKKTMQRRLPTGKPLAFPLQSNRKASSMIAVYEEPIAL